MESENYKQVKQTLWIILCANIAVAVLKVVVGAFINSASMTADGIHSLSDGSSNVVGLVGIHFAAKPEDREHPYGHHKYETLAGLFIAAMLFVVGGKIVFDAIGRFANPIMPDVTVFSLVVLIITLGINVVVTVTEHRQGRRLNSQILVADAMHTRSDVYVSIGVLTTLIGVKLGLPPIIDPIASLVVAGFIIRAAYEVLRQSTDVLVDTTVADPEAIRSIAAGLDGVRDAHHVRSRGSRSNLRIDMHVLLDPNTRIDQAHELVHSIEGEIQAKLHANAHVSIHIEPSDSY